MPPINANSIREFAYQHIREQILNFELEPGTSLSEKEISDKLQVSRTPVREAILKLAQEGLLEVYPQKGTRVALIDLALVEEARFMREQLESAIIQLACKDFPEDKILMLELNLNNQELCIQHQDHRKLFDLDEEFHRTLFDGCNKKRIWYAMQPMNTHFNRVRLLRLAKYYNWDHILLQHQKILQVIKEKDTQCAKEIISEHLKLVKRDQEALKRLKPDYFSNDNN